ncbi:patatin-like phospholipase family protein [Jannaschia sp. LMIT008]|uniref:patatin-like phospholipase family protein n=1 Tax=Jannaschia maritima TaxID=3032585 RepID=UPI002811756B|nr:patatin-like phospholipase family protein [Jannaschia sp. LMIT008]
MIRGAVLAAILGAAVAGCARIDRGPPLSCPAFLPPGMATTVLSSQGPAPDAAAPPDPVAMTARIRRDTAARIEDAILRDARATPPGQPVRFRVLALSAGGQFGAFGAGLLSGWGAERGAFDLVTGVSAGAILAPVAFAGPAFDDALSFYDGLDDTAIYRRDLLGALTGAPAVTDAAPLRAALRARVTPALVNAVAARGARGGRLLVGVTNLETTGGEVFDLTAAATGPNARDCIVAALMASAAIPGLLPPQNVNGSLYADGGLRSHVFLQAIDDARRDAARRTGRRVVVDAHIVVNGALDPPRTGTADATLLGIVDRAVTTLADEVLRDSIAEAVTFAADRPGWTLRGIRARADLSACDDADATGGFDPCVTTRLFRHGQRIGAADPIPWLDADDLRALADAL